MPKLPLPPDPAELRTSDPDIMSVDTRTVLWRIHFTEVEHPTRWNDLRRYGPVASCRFDPHAQPPQVQAEGVAYLATDVPTALAEAFQVSRVVNVWRGAPYLTGFSPARDLRLFDLTGTWPLRIGASHAINTGRKDHCRAWARALRAAWPDVDGIAHTSAMTAGRCLTLFNPAMDAFPAAPAFSEPLSHVGLENDLASAAESIGYYLL